MCVLAVLNRNDSYAYDIVAQMAEGLKMSEGTIYPLMRRLQNEGWVSTYLMESVAGPPRKYYRLTTTGKSQFVTMHAEWREFAAEVNKILGDHL